MDKETLVRVYEMYRDVPPKVFGSWIHAWACPLSERNKDLEETETITPKMKRLAEQITHLRQNYSLTEEEISYIVKFADFG